MNVVNTIHHARAVNIQQTLWLPFLYQTPTILRTPGHRAERGNVTRPQRCAYTSGADALERASIRSSGRSGRQRPPVASARARRYDLPKRTSKSRTSYDNVRTTTEDEVPMEKSAREYVPHLPFERTRPTFGRGRVNKTSMVTGAEARAFQALLALSNPDGVPKTDNPDEPDLAETISEVVGVEIPYENSLELAKEYAAKMGRGSQSTYDELIKEQTKAGGMLRQTQSLMADAQTDLRLWELLHERGLNDVIALNLDQRGGRSESPAQDTSILSTTFPKTLIVFHKALKASFPSSMYGLALLPYLQQLGPSTFAYGASTELYNRHLQLQYEQILDIRGMVRTIDEMHQNVFDYDAETRSIVQTVLDRAENVLQGPQPRAEYLFWTTKIMELNLRRLRERAVTIEESIATRAVQDAQNERLSTPSAEYIHKYGASATA